MKRRIVLVAVVAALGFPAGATAATLPPLVTVCGQGGCVATGRSNNVMEQFLAALTAQALEGGRSAPEPVPQPYFKVTVSDGRELWYAPGAQLLKTESGWKENSLARQALSATTESLEPFPAPKPTAVRVNGRAAPTPAVYAGLLADLPQADAPPGDAPTAVVEVSYGAQGPWEDARLSYAPTENTVKRADGWFAVPDELAAQVESDLRREGVQGRRTWGSSIVFALVFTGALFVGWLTFYRRKWWKTGGRKRRVKAPEDEAPRSSPRR